MQWNERTQCWMCKHRFDAPYVLPVENPEPGRFQPRFNGDALFHMQDTHGLTPDLVTSMIVNSIYELPLTIAAVCDTAALLNDGATQ